MPNQSDIDEIKNLINTPEEAEVIEEVEEVEELEEVEEAEEVTEEVTEDLPSDIKGLADAIGWTPEEVYAIKVPMLDHEDPVSLGEFKDRYKTVLQEKSNLEKQASQQQTQQQVSAEVIAAQGELAELSRQYEATNWQELEDEDPTRALLLKQKFGEAAGAANNKIMNAQQQQQQQQQQHLRAAYTQMLDFVPEWKDPGVLKADQGEIKTLMNKYGYADNEINSIQDPRQMKMLNDFRILQAQSKEADKAVKRVQKAPKVLRSVARQNKANDKTLNTAIKRAQVTGNKRDQLAAAKLIVNGV